MSKPFSDPSLLTKDRLKKELESNGVKLPRGEQKKEFYVRLYRENLSPQRHFGNGEFSSDDDGYEESPQTKQIVQRTSRSIKKVGSKEIVGNDIKSLSNDELKEELASLGQSSVGPIIPTTRNLYERKLARLRASPENNGGTVTTISKAEFSDNDFGEEEEMREEENGAEDEFFYKHGRRSGGTYDSTFTKDFKNSSTEKEVTRDMSMSSSRNIERSSTVDRKTMNKVHKRKGDKFEENSWATSSRQSEKDGGDYDEEDTIPALPASVQRALTSVRRFTPEKEQQPQLRARLWKQNTEEVPESVNPTSVKEKPKKTLKHKSNSKKWWIFVVIILILIILTCAVVYNFERLPEVKRFLTQNNKKELSSG